MQIFRYFLQKICIIEKNVLPLHPLLKESTRSKLNVIRIGRLAQLV